MQVALQFVGALGILAAFTLVQLRRLATDGWAYQSLNLVGAGILTCLALVEAQWGFVILQGVWASAALVGLTRAARRPSRPAEAADDAGGG